MDNFTHSLAGWALGQTGLKTKSRKGLAALILGANAPDIDVFFGWSHWAPLATHRGVTHSLVGGVIVLPLLLTGLLLLFDRWQVKRGGTFDSSLVMKPGWLLALAYLGAITHPLLDLQNTYAVQLFSPFSLDWFHADGLFIIDVWLWTMLAFAIWLSRRREARGDGNWGRPPIAGLGIALAYIGTGIAISAVAKQRLYADGAALTADVIVASPPPVLFWRRDLVWREMGQLSHAKYSLFSGLGEVSNVRPDGMANPFTHLAMKATPDIVDFMRWSIMPTAKVVRARCGVTVTFGDARYGNARARSSFEHVVAIPLAHPGCPK